MKKRSLLSVSLLTAMSLVTVPLAIPVAAIDGYEVQEYALRPAPIHTTWPPPSMDASGTPANGTARSACSIP